MLVRSWPLLQLSRYTVFPSSRSRCLGGQRQISAHIFARYIWTRKDYEQTVSVQDRLMEFGMVLTAGVPSVKGFFR